MWTGIAGYPETTNRNQVCVHFKVSLHFHVTGILEKKFWTRWIKEWVLKNFAVFSYL